MTGTSDNILDLIKSLDHQKLKFVIAIWEDDSEDYDKIKVYSSFDSYAKKKLINALQTATEIEKPYYEPAK